MNKLTFLLYLLIMSFIIMITFIFIITTLNMNIMIKLLMVYSILICILLSFWSKNYLYSIIMFLTLISGLLIIFLYFTSLVSNLKNLNLENKMTILSLSMSMNVISLIYLSFSQFYPSYSHLLSLKIMDSAHMPALNENIFKNILYIFYYPFNNFTLLCIFFLLLSLFSIIKICSIKNSSLRKIN